MVVRLSAVAAVVVLVAVLHQLPVVKGKGLTYACINCDNIPPRLWQECESATNREMPCYPYRLVKNTLCKRTCRAVHRKPCRLKTDVCRADPDCAHLCRKFFEYLCPLTESVGLKEDPNNICPGFDAPPPGAANPLLVMAESNATMRYAGDRDGNSDTRDKRDKRDERAEAAATEEELEVEELMRGAFPGGGAGMDDAVVDERAQRAWYERPQDRGAD